MRNKYFDSLRGLAILMVVAIHVMVVNTEGFYGQIMTLFRQVLNMAVPLFLAISGFFLARKSLNTKSEILAFWKKQIPKVYIPAIVWSLPLYYFALKSGFNVWHETF